MQDNRHQHSPVNGNENDGKHNPGQEGPGYLQVEQVKGDGYLER